LRRRLFGRAGEFLIEPEDEKARRTPAGPFQFFAAQSKTPGDEVTGRLPL
jgi:hypothetical protein